MARASALVSILSSQTMARNCLFSSHVSVFSTPVSHSPQQYLQKHFQLRRGKKLARDLVPLQRGEIECLGAFPVRPRRVSTRSSAIGGERNVCEVSGQGCGSRMGNSSNDAMMTSGIRIGTRRAGSDLKTYATGGGIVAEPSSKRKGSKKDAPPDVKLTQLRELMDKNGIDAYIVPSEDAHQSEFIADCFMRRAFISGFTGSAGSVIISKDRASLWTDGRYFLQAENQLGPHWTLMRAGTAGVPSMSEWCRDNLPEGSVVGVDPYLFTSDAFEELKRTLAEKNHSISLLYDCNLVDQVWGSARPNPPSAPLRVHDIKYAGVDVSTKLANLRKELVSVGATVIVVTMLDEIAWLLNLRGSDVPCSPVTYAYVVVELETATLFVDESKVTHDVAQQLAQASVTVKPYESLVPEIRKLALEGSKLWLDASRVSVAIKNAFNDACLQYYSNLGSLEASKRELKEANGPASLHRSSPISLSKALKNDAELEGMKNAHLRDAAALTEFWSWLEHKIVVEKQSLSEVEVTERLYDFRAKQSGFLDVSFETISGSGPNGAIVHYRAEAGTCAQVDEHNLFLLDSGAQYVDGTTDITRTVHFGVPTPREKECFTRVLQGHIAVDQAVFPEYTPGFVLDVLARNSLWKIGLDYRHGTGHGVGAALNVHEGPQSMSARFGNMTGLQPGMIISNEPGYYEDRVFGIRIENLVIIREAETENRFGGVTFLSFEKLSFVPIQAKMLELSLLSDSELTWLNDYHAQVWEKVSPLVAGDALEWLHRNTRPIQRPSGSKKPQELSTTTSV
ncbi:Xaa-Pro aminopeptidase [Marchantia polymorpha subsp. ruderalis]|uniref:Xaa-Pro aminopeptidase P n=2 Tax=Marchantia polymorpha TaxID=3197 RepID=A0AAF6BUY5_MARPO|nr:hypothetical protein MARPO_0046s0011 [Marchantia polymorpha]BBN15819.1 hypothetical protein Mp_7g01130 [Marchantia polymorpha subsp. ruderalis]|eukprot:PTQ39186.1 hypothetical protein MARPO_0046s0011 [Marchantia polymorpha]